MCATSPHYAEFYDPRLVDLYDQVNPVDEYAPFVLATATRLGSRNVVDLGCGTGLLTQRLIDAGFEVTGIEPSGPMLDRARSRDQDQRGRWLQGSAERVADLGADLVLMTGHVAQFFLEEDDWIRALTSIREGLNGYLLFDARNPERAPFGSWPTVDRPRVVDSPSGAVHWWHGQLEWTGQAATYELHYLFSDGDEVKSVNRLVFRSNSELASQLHDAGFEVIAEYGDWLGSPLTSRSEELIYLAKVAASRPA